MAADAGQALVLLNACCLLNLYATGRIRDIFQVPSVRFAVAERAAAETLYVRRGGSGDDAGAHEPVDLQPLVAEGLLQIVYLEEEDEAATFVQFAVELDDGETMTCALAVHRDAAVATDDRKALRVLGVRAPEEHVYTTAQIIKHWAEADQVAGPDLKQVLMAVHERARFAPGKHDQLQSW